MYAIRSYYGCLGYSGAWLTRRALRAPDGASALYFCLGVFLLGYSSDLIYRVITSYSIHYTKLYEDRLQVLVEGKSASEAMQAVEQLLTAKEDPQ